MYRLWDDFDLTDELSQFRMTLNQIMVTDEKKSKDIEEQIDETNITSEDSIVVDYKQLAANPFDPILSSDLSQINTNSVISSQSAEVNSRNEVENKKEKSEVKITLKILGILSADNNKRAILDIGDNKVRIVKVGSVIRGLKIKKITANTVVITKENKELVYEFGGGQY